MTRIQKNGFTLIELMIVVVIIGILAAIAIPKFNQVSKSAKEAEAVPILKQLFTLQNRYYQQHDVYATTLNDLEGGAQVANSAKYYSFDVQAHASGFCAAARLTADGTAAGLQEQSMDANRAHYFSASCS